MRRVAGEDDRHVGRTKRAAVERRDVSERQRAQRPFGADRHVSVRVIAVEQLREHAIGERRRHVAELQQTIEPQLAHAIELALLQTRPDQHVGDQLEPLIEKPAERRQADQRRVVADVGVELRTDPSQRFVDVERRAVPAPLVEHVRGDRGKPGPSRGIRRRADRQQHEHADERHLPVFGGPDAKSAAERLAPDLGKREGAFRPECRQPAAIHPHYDTATGPEPGSANARRPRGTTLRTTRCAGRR